MQDNYKSLFTGGGNGKPTAPSYKEFSRKWGWFKTISELGNDNIQQFDKITELSCVQVFNHLSYLIDKNNALESQRKFEEQMRTK